MHVMTKLLMWFCSEGFNPSGLKGGKMMWGIFFRIDYAKSPQYWTMRTHISSLLMRCRSHKKGKWLGQFSTSGDDLITHCLCRCIWNCLGVPYVYLDVEKHIWCQEMSCQKRRADVVQLCSNTSNPTDCEVYLNNFFSSLLLISTYRSPWPYEAWVPFSKRSCRTAAWKK